MTITLSDPRGTASTEVFGAPYTHGDPVAVEVNGEWREAVVDGITDAPTARFGLRWTMFVILREPAEGEAPGVWVRCDDNGRNHTWRHQVCPSSRIEDAHDGYTGLEL